MKLLDLAERRKLPDWLIRVGIRRLLADRRKTLKSADNESHRIAVEKLTQSLCDSDVAEHTDKANEQHYEVPAKFFTLALGAHLKYSCCHFPAGDESLDRAESKMLGLTCERAQIEDGMEILELGCGWGALTLWMGENFPNARITAVSNSASQRDFILERCRQRGVENVRVVTADMRDFETDATFDRVVSVEMFEHMRNYEQLLHRISHWLKPDGKLFVHIFVHRDSPYLFETEGESNWMGRHFFTGGIMPSDDLLLYFQRDVSIERHWRVNGEHYAKTCEAWLKKLDANRTEALECLSRDIGPAEAALALQRWRMFFMACAELFHSHSGNEWFVAHYRFENRRVERSPADDQAISALA